MEYNFVLKSLLIIIWTNCIFCFPSNRTPKHGNDLNKKDGQKKYLTHYGYWHKKEPGNPKLGELEGTDHEFTDAVKRYQELWHLNKTGIMDDSTIKLMETDRCGNSDEELIKFTRRSKRYRINDRWYKKAFTYRITKYPSTLAKTQVDKAIDKAFIEWSKVTSLTFQRVSTFSDIEILFASYYHGDANSFDGRAGDLAHAFWPSSGGDVHFDDSEIWTINTAGGTDLFQIAVHEIGHSLGLGHTNQWGSVMWPYYSYKSDFKLGADDIRGIQAIYGKQVEMSSTTPTPGGISTISTKSTTSTTNPTPPTSSGSSTKATPPSASPSAGTTQSTTPSPPTQPRSTVTGSINPAGFCTNPKLDAITVDRLGRTFVFKGEHYAMLNNVGIVQGYPKLIASDLPDLPTHVDAAVFIPTIYKVQCYWWCRRELVELGGTYIFKNSTYYRYQNGFQSSDSMATKFPGMPTEIDAAYTLERNKLYFVKGNQLWRMTISEKTVDPGYPVSLAGSVSGLPSTIDAVFQAPHPYYVLRYYFSGTQYYRVTGFSPTVDLASIPYPRPIGKWWFNCITPVSSEVSSFRRREFDFDDAVKVPKEIYVNNNGHLMNATQIAWNTDEDVGSSAVKSKVSMLIYSCAIMIVIVMKVIF